MKAETALAVSELSYCYPGGSTPAVDGMSFDVRPGEIFGFLGPSGAGKTSTQRAVLGLVSGWTGRIEVLGRDRRGWGQELFDRVGVAFELPVGYPRLSGREDLTHFANLHRRSCRQAGEVLESVGLAEAADRPVGSYSKGMRVRLNLARAILHSPELLFLDEPTAGLDPVNAHAVRELILAEQKRGCTVFVTTHDMATADAICDRVAFVVDGRIAACGVPRELRLQHGRREVRVEYRKDGETATVTFALDDASSRLVELLVSGTIETIHTSEATLDQVFTLVTGREL